jgi:hypothetical protein
LSKSLVYFRKEKKTIREKTIPKFALDLSDEPFNPMINKDNQTPTQLPNP